MTLYNSGVLLSVQFSDLLESVFSCVGYENVAVNVLSLASDILCYSHQTFSYIPCFKPTK